MHRGKSLEEERDNGGKRERVFWAIKSCPQIAGSGSPVRFQRSTSSLFLPLDIHLGFSQLSHMVRLIGYD